MEEQGIKIETSIIGVTPYKIWKNNDGKEELKFAGHDMGNRIYVVKWLDEKTLIVKVPNKRVLCGARGMGNVTDFPTNYYICQITDDVLPSTWNAWSGKIDVMNEMTCGRQWKKGIAELEEFWKQKKLWVIFIGSNYGHYFFYGTEEEAEKERARKALWEKAIGRKRLADENEIKTRKIDPCHNHINFKSQRYSCNCEKCK